MSCQITVRASGHQFSAEPGETILAAALRAGVGLPYGCKNGACGNCKGAVLEGEIEQGPHTPHALSAEEAAAGKALFCCAQARTDLVIEAREIAHLTDIPVRKMPARLVSIERVSEDVAVVSVQLPAAERLQYRAGQYLDFILRDNTRRSYSIATPPHADELLQFHVRHMPGGRFTDALFGIAREGQPAFKERDLLRCEGPLGSFYLREESRRPIVLLASGTGFAPIKAIAEQIFHQGKHDDVPVLLYWGGRRPADLYQDALARQWAAERPNFRYVPVVSDALPEDGWTGRTGFVHEAVMADLPDLSRHQVYACGAPVMVEAAQRDFVERCGLPEDRFYADAFTSQADLAQVVD